MLKASFRGGFVDASLADSLVFEIGDDYGARSARLGLLFPELQSYDVLDELGSVTAATLILYGEEEPGGQVGGPALLAAIPGAILGYVSGAGHFPFVEQPADFLDRVDEFLDSGR